MKACRQGTTLSTKGTWGQRGRAPPLPQGGQRGVPVREAGTHLSEQSGVLRATGGRSTPAVQRKGPRLLTAGSRRDSLQEGSGLLRRARGKSGRDGDGRRGIRSAGRLRGDPLGELGGVRRERAPSPCFYGFSEAGPGASLPRAA